MFVLKEPAITILTVFAIAALGYLIGRIRICNIGLSTAAIFLSGLIFGHFGANIPSSVQMTGLALFITSVGLSAGPTFVERLRKNGKAYVVLCLATALTGSAVCAVLVRIAGIETPVAVGMMTGAFTTSPGFAAAKEAVSASAEAVTKVAAGYGIMYPFGSLGKVLFVQMVPKVLKADMEHERKLIAIKEKPAAGEAAGRLIQMDPMGFFVLALAIVCGILLGSVTVPLPGAGTFSLGMTGGPLIIGLLLGHLGKIGPLSLEVDKKILNPMKEIGLILFFAGAGVEGGKSLVPILKTYGILLPVLGLFLIFVPLCTGYILSTKVLKLPMLNGLGAMTASMTCTPSLAALIQAAGTDDVAAAYAATYPIALVTLVFVVQFLVKL